MGSTFFWGWLCLASLSSAQPIRVALLDFTADDNSWPASQAAADFTAVLQTRLAAEPGAEWVERAQLKLAEKELQISELGLMAGSEAVRRGRWVKADWLLQGRFGLNDGGSWIARLELLDLNHAELIAARTVDLAAGKTISATEDKLALVAQSVNSMLVEGERWLQRATNQLTVAPVFFSEVTGRFQGWEGVLRPVVQLPFPYTQTGIAGAYEASIQNLSSMLGVYNKHQAYGFPSGVPKQ